MAELEGRFVPTPDGPNVEFYRHAVTGTLHLQRCASCSRFQHPPRYRCPACGSTEMIWVPSTGAGTVHTWTVTHRAVDPAWAGEIPYATVVVELDEGVRLVGALENLAPADLALDLPVSLRIEPAGDEFAFLWFRPASLVTTDEEVDNRPVPLDAPDWEIGAQDRQGGAALSALTAIFALCTGVLLVSATLFLVNLLSF